MADGCWEDKLTTYGEICCSNFAVTVEEENVHHLEHKKGRYLWHVLNVWDICGMLQMAAVKGARMHFHVPARKQRQQFKLPGEKAYLSPFVAKGEVFSQCLDLCLAQHRGDFFELYDFQTRNNHFGLWQDFVGFPRERIFLLRNTMQKTLSRLLGSRGESILSQTSGVLTILHYLTNCLITSQQHLFFLVQCN